MSLQCLGVSGRKSSSSRRYSYNEGCQALVTPGSLKLQFSMVIAAQRRTPSPRRARCPLGCCLPAGCGREQCPISACSASTSPGEGRATLRGGQPHYARSLDDQAMKMNGKKTVSYTDCIATAYWCSAVASRVCNQTGKVGAQRSISQRVVEEDILLPLQLQSNRLFVSFNLLFSLYLLYLFPRECCESEAVH